MNASKHLGIEHVNEKPKLFEEGVNPSIDVVMFVNISREEHKLG